MGNTKNTIKYKKSSQRHEVGIPERKKRENGKTVFQANDWEFSKAALIHEASDSRIIANPKQNKHQENHPYYITIKQGKIWRERKIYLKHP